MRISPKEIALAKRALERIRRNTPAMGNWKPPEPFKVKDVPGGRSPERNPNTSAFERIRAQKTGDLNL